MRVSAFAHLYHPRPFHHAPFAISPSMSTDPPSNRAVLSIDVGTSATKAALCYIDSSGKLGPISRRPHSINSSEHRAVTQQPADWYNAAIATCRSALCSAPDNLHIIAIAVTGQMQDLIAVGPNPPSLLHKDAILYSDSRALQIAQQMSRNIGFDIPATSILPKLALLPKPLEPDSSSYSLLLGAADYVIYQFAEHPKPKVTDATTVSTTGLTEAPHRTYNINLLEKANLSDFVPFLPKILETTQPTGRLSSSVAEHLGSPNLAGIPLVHAGGDAFSATVGAECDVAGNSYLYAGTSGWIGGTVSANISDYKTSKGSLSSGLFALAHAKTPNDNIVVGSMASVCGAFDYVRNMFLAEIPIDQFNVLANETTVGANGVAFVPYIAGSRCPPANGLATGSFHGLRTSSTRADIARATVEGVVYALRLCRDELPVQIVQRMDVDPLRVVGGGAKCATFVNGIAALVAGRAGVVVGETDGVGVRGAAATACVAVKLDNVLCDWNSVYRHVEVDELERQKWEAGFSRWLRFMKAEQDLCGSKA